DLPNAVAWGSSIFQSAMVLGPVLGGMVYGFAGVAIPVYAIAAIAYGCALLQIMTIHIEAPQQPRPKVSAGMVWDGLRYIWRNQLILGAISLDLFAVLLGGAVALLPVYA